MGGLTVKVKYNDIIAVDKDYHDLTDGCNDLDYRLYLYDSLNRVQTVQCKVINNHTKLWG